MSAPSAICYYCTMHRLPPYCHFHAPLFEKKNLIPILESFVKIRNNKH